MLIEGAGCVGKTYTVEEFARNEYESYVIVDFSKAGDDVKALFDDLTDIPFLTQALAAIHRVRLHERRSLIVFDGVQYFPRAREAVKFLVEDGRYDYIETGRLISIHESVKDIIIPSEEERIRMLPMDFEEFCWAMGDEVTVPLIRSGFENREPLGSDLHEKVMRMFRRYMIVGGMPKAVESYVRTEDLVDAEIEKRRILALYRDEISGMSGRRRNRTGMLFESIPSGLGRHDKRLSPKDIDEKSKAEYYDEPVFWLGESMIADVCYDTHVPSTVLNINRRSLKVYMGDTGLLVSLAMEKEPGCDAYPALLRGDLRLNEGMFTENVVAQMLRANGNNLFFHTFYMEGGKNRYEMDFLVRNGRRIDPIEVKSSDYTAHKSMDVLMERYSKILGQPYIVYTKDLKKVGNILFIPIYMAMFLRGIGLSHIIHGRSATGDPESLRHGPDLFDIEWRAGSFLNISRCRFAEYVVDRLVGERHPHDRRYCRHRSENGFSVVVPASVASDRRLDVVHAGDHRCIDIPQTFPDGSGHRAYAGLRQPSDADGVHPHVSGGSHGRERPDALLRCCAKEHDLAPDGVYGIHEDVEIPFEDRRHGILVHVDLHGLDVYVGINGPGPLAGHLRLRPSDRPGGGEDLPVHVTLREHVPVHGADASDPRPHEPFQGVSAHGTVPYYDGGCPSQPLDALVSDEERRPLAHTVHSAILRALSYDVFRRLSADMPQASDSCSANRRIPKNPFGVQGASDSRSSRPSGMESISLDILSGERERMRGLMDMKHPSSAKGLE